MKISTVRVLQLIVLAFICILAAGCVPKYAVPAASAASTDAPGGAARIFFFKTGSHRAQNPVFRETEMVGALPPQSFFYVDVPAGEHIFIAHMPWYPLSLKANVEAGKTYYVFIDVGSYAAQMEPIAPGTPRQAEKDTWLNSLQHVVTNPESKQDIENQLESKNEKEIAAIQSGGGKVVNLGPEHAF